MVLKLILISTLFFVAVVRTNENKTQTEGPSKLISDRSFHQHVPDPTLRGIWKKRIAWRARWVKTWKEKKIYVAVWKKMWGPLVVKEWVPIPKPPPGWQKPYVGPILVKQRSV